MPIKSRCNQVLQAKYFLTFLVVSIFSNHAHAQLYGAQWMIGPNTSVLDFRPLDSLHLYAINGWMNTYLANACISDSGGNLLYYTNGVFIAGNNGDSLANGNGLSPCQFTTQYESQGMPIQQSVMFLPMPGNERYYYLFHFSGDSIGGHPGTMYYSIIDAQGDSGKGEVVQKNVIYYKSTFRGGGMTACKHANGRDWWIVIAGLNSNTFYKFLLTPNGISDTLSQSIGPVYDSPLDDASSCFSLDGSRYVTGCVEGYITVMDFDRCTGEFSNPVLIYNNASPNPITQPDKGCVSLAFSPSGRFVYASDRVNLVQYDLENSNIQDSVEVYLADSTDYAQIDLIGLASNGKLYGSTWNGGFYFVHVLNYPDSLGHSCGFLWGGQPTLSNNSVNLPNVPNYRLGAQSGSACDTLTSISNLNLVTSNILRVMPNPADKYIYVEMGMQGNYEMQLLNETGQVMTTKQTKQVDIFDTEKLASGVYFLKVTDKTQHTIISRKLIIQH